MTGNQTIICGDAAEEIPKLGEFSYVITDPPYPTGGESSMRNPKSVMEARKMIDAMFHSFLFSTLRSVKMTESSCFFIFTDWRQISFMGGGLWAMGYTQQSCIVWDKCRGNLSNKFHPSHEQIIFGSRNLKGIAEGYLGKDIVSIRKPAGKNKTHPFEKPSELIETLLKAFKPGRILDPFMGTGSTLVAAKNLGWDAVGVEMSEEFCETARERLKS